MSKMGWKIWVVALGAWGLYSCWHFGYQSGYADGHETACQMYQAQEPVYQMAAGRNPTIDREFAEVPESDH